MRRVWLAGAAALALAEQAAAQSTEAAPVDEVVVTAIPAERSTLALDTRAVTASRLGVTLRELPVSGSVVSQAVIQERGFATALDAVTSTVGVTGGVTLGATPRFSSRGFTVNNITVLRDGVRQNTLAQSARTLDPFVFDRIEVLKGPASVLYGEGAIAGAVNLVSKEPDESPAAEALASYGSFDTWRAGAGVGGPLAAGVSGRLDAVAAESGGYVDRSGYDRQAVSGSLRLSDGRDFAASVHADWTQDDVDTYFGTPLIYDGVIRADGTFALARANLSAGDRLVNPRIDGRTRKLNYNPLNSFSRSEYLYLRQVADWRPTEALDLRLTGYQAFQEQDYRNSEGFAYNPVTGLVERDALGFIERDDELLGLRGDGLWRSRVLGRPSRLSFGFDVSRNEQIRGTRPAFVPVSAVSPPAVDPFNPRIVDGPDVRSRENARALVEIAAIYAEHLLELTPSLTLVTGLRYDDIRLERKTLPLNPATYEQDYGPTTGRVGLVWEPRAGLNLYAAYTEAVDPVVQLASQTASSADFGLQKGRQTEVGAKLTFWGSRADATLALYDIEKTDILTSTVVNGVRVSQQIGGQSAQGVEAALVVAPAPGWTVEANAAYTDAKFDAFNENLGAGIVSRAGRRPDNVPEVSANLFVSKRFSNGLGGQVQVRHVGDRFANTANTFELESYTLLDAAASYRWSGYEVVLRGRNLADETYADWQVFTTTPFLHLGDPRSVELELRARF